MKSTDLNRGEIVLYRTHDGKTALDVRLEAETVWLTLNQISHLFGRDKSVVSRHLGNIFRTKELARQAVVAKYATTAADGKTYQGVGENKSVPISTQAGKDRTRVCGVIGKWNRTWPFRLIEGMNPGWRDRYDEIC